MITKKTLLIREPGTESPIFRPTLPLEPTYLDEFGAVTLTRC